MEKVCKTNREELDLTVMHLRYFFNTEMYSHRYMQKLVQVTSSVDPNALHYKLTQTLFTHLATERIRRFGAR